MSELQFEDVQIRYGHRRTGFTAVDHVSLTVPPGQVVGLVGESGSGKSTLARAAVGLSPVTGGRVLLDGIDMSRLGRRDRRVQMVFQDPESSLDPRMTIGESIMEAFPRGLYRGATARGAELLRLLEMVNLGTVRGNMLPGQLSGGQRQRVALARALAGRPKVVIADEITSALDVSVQGAVLNLLRDLQRQLGLSMLFISHNLAVVRYVSDVIAVMYLGRIVEVGPTEELLANPQHEYTRELLLATPTGTRANLVDDFAIARPYGPPTACRCDSLCGTEPATNIADPAAHTIHSLHHTVRKLPDSAVRPNEGLS